MYHPRRISNVSFRRRIRQVIVLVFTIIIGILISQAAQAQSQFRSHREKGSKIGNNRVISHQVSFSHRECRILALKRNHVPKSSLFAANRKPNRKSIAEADISRGGQ